jgi:ribonucleotide monophosphatase NagD (HAD superfamily)
MHEAFKSGWGGQGHYYSCFIEFICLFFSAHDNENLFVTNKGMQNKGFIVDLDGTMWYRDKDKTLPIEGASLFISKVQHQMIAVSNTGEKTGKQVTEKIFKIFGFEIDALTALDHLALRLQEAHFNETLVISNAECWKACIPQGNVFGYRDLKQDESGTCIAFCSDGLIPGNYRELQIKLRDYLIRGASVWVTSLDETLTVLEGGVKKFIPGPGQFIKAVLQLVPREVNVRCFGKGSNEKMAASAVEILKKRGCKDIIFIGDNLQTDIREGHSFRSTTVHVLTGCHDHNECKRDIPHIVADSILEVAMLLDTINDNGKLSKVARCIMGGVHCTFGCTSDFLQTKLNLIEKFLWPVPQRLTTKPRARSVSVPVNLSSYRCSD